MPTKGDKSIDSEGSSLAGVLEMLQEQSRAMQEQHKAHAAEDAARPNPASSSEWPTSKR